MLDKFNSCAVNVNNSLLLLDNISDNLNNSVQIISDTVYRISQLDHQLDAMLAQMDVDLEKYKAIVPIVERQLNNISERIDRITDSLLARQEGLSESDLQQKSMLLDMLSQANESFNNMIMRLLMR